MQCQKNKKVKRLNNKKNEGSHTQINQFLRIYKVLNDWHLPIFKAVQEFTKAKYVLYPGSHKHISPSLFFSKSNI